MYDGNKPLAHKKNVKTPVAKLRDVQTLWLAFRGVLQVLSCWLRQWIKEAQSGSQGQCGHLPQGRVEGSSVVSPHQVL